MKFRSRWVPEDSKSLKSGFESVWQTLPWSLRESKVTAEDGTVLFHLSAVEAPEAWSQLAVDIAASKYFRREGVNGQGETSVKQMIARVVSAIANQGRTQKYFYDEKSARAFELDLAYLLVHQMAAFNSPVWFNCGLFQSYGIEGSGGGYYWNAMNDKIEETLNAYQHPQSSACFIQSVEDDLSSIFDLLKLESRVFKYGSGTGTNFSPLRAKGEKLSGGGTTSGLMSFLEVFDRAASATKSGGTTRRAAKMVCLNVDHPEIFDFIRWKVREEEKAQALIREGYEADFNGEAYHTVSGQNSNNSVRLTDAFLNSVQKDASWELRERTTKKTKQVSARELFKEMAQAAWACGDPGIQFEDTIQKWHTCKQTGPIRASNPCSEYMFLDDSACNLSSLNLVKFLDSESSFRVEDFSHAIRLLIVAQDILVDLSSYPSRKIAENSHRFRPLGLGFANLGSVFLRKGMAYSSQEARALASAISAFILGTAILTSFEIAQHMGPFEGFKQNEKSYYEILDLHRAEALEIHHSESDTKLFQETHKIWESLEHNPPRNAQLTAIAPTGTIGLLMDCDTMGIEPEYSIVKNKKLAGGGSLKIVNQAIKAALAKMGLKLKQAEAIEDHLLKGGSLNSCPYLSEEQRKIFRTAHSYFPEDILSPQDHLEMLAAVQPFVSGAISKTVNLPSHATANSIEEIFFEAWRLGLKSISVYRDGSKLSQPLNADKNPVCPQCGYPTLLDGGCFRCPECGTSVSCAS